MKGLLTKTALVIVIAHLVGVANLLSAQNYHFKKGEEYYRIKWYDFAFSEYEDGRKAGEASSALSSAMCYLHEKGTPRNVKKAIAILDEWAKKDAATCLFAAIFWDPEHQRHGFYTDDFRKIKGVSIVGGPPYVYEIYNWGIGRFIPENFEDYGIKTDLAKAKQYAAQLVKLCDTEGAKTYLQMLSDRGKSPLDKLKTWRSGYHESYSSILEEAIKNSSSFLELAKVIEVDFSQTYLTDSNHHLTEWTEKLHNYEGVLNAMSNKCYSLYEQLYNQKQGDLSSIEQFLGEKEYKRIVSDALPIMATRCSERQMEWLIGKLPYESSNYQLKSKWTLKKMRTVIYDFGPWEKVKEVFDSPMFVEVEGPNPFGNRFRQVIRGLATTVNDYYKHQDAEDELYRAKRDGASEICGVFSTKRVDYIWWEKLWQDSKVMEMGAKERINGVSFDEMLKTCSSEGKRLNKKTASWIISVLDDNIAKIKKDFPERKDYNDIIKTKTMQRDFAQLMLNESTGKVIYGDYKEFAATKSKYYKYAEYRIGKLQTVRESAETKLGEFLGHEKSYKAFCSNLASGKRAKLTSEQISPVIDNVVKPSMSKYDEAYSICPEKPVPDIRIRLDQEVAAAEIAIAFSSGENVAQLAEAFKKKYPQSPYLSTVEGYLMDSVAIEAAGALTKDSSKEEIKHVQSLPVTKDGAKRIKELTKKSYLKSK